MKNNSQDYKKAWTAIDNAQKIFLTSHESTDGDDLGTVLALHLALQKMGKETHVIVRGGVPHMLEFLPGSKDVKEEFENRPYDLIITSGCNKLERTGFEELKNISAPKINFDHHPDNQMFADINVVDSEMAAVAEMAYYFLKSNDKVVIDKDVATCLLTGIFTDTGGFKHSNTTDKVYEVAADLLKKGARIDRISLETFGNKRPETLRAWAKGLENTRFDPEKNMVFSVMTEADMKEVGADDDDLTGFVEVLNHIPEAKFSLLLRQDGDTVKGSLRSDPHKKTDVSQIAKNFGGGGHKYASGFKIKGKLVRGDNGWQIVK